MKFISKIFALASVITLAGSANRDQLPADLPIVCPDCSAGIMDRNDHCGYLVACAVPPDQKGQIIFRFPGYHADLGVAYVDPGKILGLLRFTEKFSVPEECTPDTSSSIPGPRRLRPILQKPSNQI